MKTTMELILGGASQGKEAYAKKKYSKAPLYDETNLDALFDVTWQEEILWNHFHRCVRLWQQKGKTLEQMQQYVDAVCAKTSHLILISNEVGNGVVPLQQEDRAYRDLVGALLIRYAKKAERVERIICQIPQKIK